jgi:hypothetical protein
MSLLPLPPVSPEPTAPAAPRAPQVAPNCLVLCLKRFGLGRFSKINRRVAAGETLNLAPFMADAALDKVGPPGGAAPACVSSRSPAAKRPPFLLTSNCTPPSHARAPRLYPPLPLTGSSRPPTHTPRLSPPPNSNPQPPPPPPPSTTYGHYVAYVRAGDGRWYLCDDDSVMPVSLGKVWLCARPGRAPRAAAAGTACSIPRRRRSGDPAGPRAPRLPHASSPPHPPRRTAAPPPPARAQVLSANAYMLFYERDTPKPAPDPSHRRAARAAPAEPTASVASSGAAGEDEGEEVGSSFTAAATTPGASPPRARGPPAFVDAAPVAAPPAGVGLPSAASVPPLRLPPPRPLVARHSVAAPTPVPSAAEQLQERLSRVSTAPAALVRMAGAADDSSAAPSPSSSGTSDGEAIASLLAPLGATAPERGSGAGGRRARGRASTGEEEDSSEGGEYGMPSPLELLAAARAQAEAAAVAAGRPQSAGRSSGGGAARGGPGPAALPSRPSGAGDPQQAAAGATASAFAAAAAAAGAAGEGLPPIEATLRQEVGGQRLVLRAQLPGVTSSRDVRVALLPGLLQVRAAAGASRRLCSRASQRARRPRKRGVAEGWACAQPQAGPNRIPPRRIAPRRCPSRGATSCWRRSCRPRPPADAP